jgi:DsbE subfamily thiol:disulfide oxidoreductase
VKNKAAILTLLASLVLIAALFLKPNDEGSRRAAVGASAPDLELFDIQRNKVTLSSLQGSVVLINFWATWCESCVVEIPSLQRLFNRFSENPRFRMITIVYRDNIQSALEYLNQQGHSFPVYANTDGSAAKKYGITGVPESFIIDKQGILREKIIGPAQWDTPQVFDFFQSLVDEP